MHSACYVVFARAPVAGAVKTRLFQGHDVADAARASLGRTLSPEDAAALHAACIFDVCKKGPALGQRRLYTTAGPVAEPGAETHPVLVAAAARFGFALRLQTGEDLGARMHAALCAELAAGASAVVLVGTDSPTLPAAFIRRAARRLLDDRTDVVLGPATDGGYYLVGVRRPLPALFAPGIAWGSTSVLATTLARLRGLQAEGLRAELLPFWYDVDTPADVRLLSEHLGVDPRLRLAAPRTAAWLDAAGLSAPR